MDLSVAWTGQYKFAEDVGQSSILKKLEIFRFQLCFWVSKLGGLKATAGVKNRGYISHFSTL